MFHRKHNLLNKTGPDGIGRYDFLRLLKKEFLETDSQDNKYQILANFANFAYDPINYNYIRSLHLIELFLENLWSENEIFINYSIAALCNLCTDPLNKEIIINKNGLTIISHILYNENDEVILNAITTLILLGNIDINNIYTTTIVDKIKDFQNSNNPQIKNLATIFLKKHNLK